MYSHTLYRTLPLFKNSSLRATPSFRPIASRSYISSSAAPFTPSTQNSPSLSHNGALDSNQKSYKPNKAPSSLKRAASASNSIRSNPTPTRSPIRPVYSFATAERYNLPVLARHLPAGSHKFQDAWWVPLSKEGGAEAWVYGNGTMVSWGLEEDEARLVVEGILNQAGPEAQFVPLKTVETEEMEFAIDPAEKTRLQGDLIMLGEAPTLTDPSIMPPHLLAPSPTDSTSSALSPPSFPFLLPFETLPARYSFSQALARSTALSAVESSLDSYLSSVELLPQKLLETGKPGLKRKEIIQKLGQLLKFRQGVNLTRENFGDTPDFYWSEPQLEVHFNRLSEALEIRERLAAMNKKIDYAAEVQVTLRELLTESSAHDMEVIIIVLIAVEAAIAIVRDGPELWHMAFGEDEPASSAPKHSQLSA